MIKNLRGALCLLAATACAGDSLETAGYQGIVELEEVTLAFEVGGQIESLLVIRGDVVEAGAEIGRLDSTLEEINREAKSAELAAVEARLALLQAGSRPEEVRATAAELRAARSQVALLERNLARQERLQLANASTLSAVDQTETELQTARARVAAIQNQLRAVRDGARNEEVEGASAQVDAARAGVTAIDERLARYALVAEISGLVLDRHAEPGEIVAPGTPIVTLADPTRPFVEVFVPQEDITDVSVGMPAQVTIDAIEGTVDGEVEHIARRTEFTPRFIFSERERPNLVIRVRIRIQDPEQQLRAGVPAFATFGGS